MNKETTNELLEILNAFELSINELLARRGYDETPPEIHAEINNSGKTYNTTKLTTMFLDLERDGITAIDFSLLIDLVNRECLEDDN